MISHHLSLQIHLVLLCQRHASYTFRFDVRVLPAEFCFSFCRSGSRQRYHLGDDSDAVGMGRPTAPHVWIISELSNLYQFQGYKRLIWTFLDFFKAATWPLMEITMDIVTYCCSIFRIVPSPNTCTCSNFATATRVGYGKRLFGIHCLDFLPNPPLSWAPIRLK